MQLLNRVVASSFVLQEMLKVTKKEIVKAISEEIGLTQLKTKEIVQKTFDAIVETLVTDRRIELRNFGVFEVKKRAARKARNPRTRANVNVPEKYVVTFKPGKEMEQKIRQLEQQAAMQDSSSVTSEKNVFLGDGGASSPSHSFTPPPPQAPINPYGESDTFGRSDS